MLAERHFHEHKEYRAPTDESVRLLRDMEKARESVLASISISDNSFNAVVHVMQDFLSCKNIFAVIFTMNDKKHDVRVETEYSDSIEVCIEKVVGKVAERIACEILCRPMNGALKQVMGKI